MRELLAGVESVVDLRDLCRGVLDRSLRRVRRQADEDMRDIVVDVLGEAGGAAFEAQFQLARGYDDVGVDLALL